MLKSCFLFQLSLHSLAGILSAPAELGRRDTPLILPFTTIGGGQESVASLENALIVFEPMKAY